MKGIAVGPVIIGEPKTNLVSPPDRACLHQMLAIAQMPAQIGIQWREKIKKENRKKKKKRKPPSIHSEEHQGDLSSLPDEQDKNQLSTQ